MKKLIVVAVVIALVSMSVCAMAAGTKAKGHATKSTKAARTPKLVGNVAALTRDPKGKLLALVVDVTSKTGVPMRVTVAVTAHTKFYVNKRAATAKDVKEKQKIGAVLVAEIKGGKATATLIRVLVAPAPKPAPVSTTPSTTSSVGHK